MLPNKLLDSYQHYSHRFQQKTQSLSISTLAATRLQATSPLLWSCSQFVAEFSCQNPQYIIDMLSQADLQQANHHRCYTTLVKSALAEIDDEQKLSKALRQCRNQEMVRIIWRDFCHWSTTQQTLADLSRLADALILQALQLLYQWHCERYGQPLDQQQQPQQLLVIAVGKLGGFELNMSSDIDLIFAYPENCTYLFNGQEKSSAQFFARLAQALINILSENTAEGFVYRVDTRLRPYGNSGGQLVYSLNALETYYQQQGREWERYALIKARLINQHAPHASKLLQLINKFVYRRYIDYGVIQALRDMKALIQQEIKQKSLQNDIKRGRGGIREIEFITQCFQLIRGGQDKNLQDNALLSSLQHLSTGEYLPENSINTLTDAYLFLRKAENCLQAYNDQQTHTLPDDAIGQLRLATVMGSDSWKKFHKIFRTHCINVEKQFSNIISEETRQADTDNQLSTLRQVWLQKITEQKSLVLLSQQGFQNSAAILTRLKSLHNSPRLRIISGKGRTRLDELMPTLLSMLVSIPAADTVLRNIIPIIEAILQRSVYFSLLLENPNALSQLIQLCLQSDWIAEQLARHPILLDELIDNRFVDSTLDINTLQTELHQLLTRQPNLDIEQEMNLLCQFKQAQVLRIAMSNLVNKLSASEVNLSLSNIAQVILNKVQNIVLQQLIQKYKINNQKTVSNPDELHFAIIAYGKLGSLEMSYHSDLDLVFLYESENLSLVEFYTRLAQRIIHYITTLTANGRLYEVDTRLRPSGSAGLLVTSFNAFKHYQQHEAWTWEYQAITKARFICGSQALHNAFEKLRIEVLTKVKSANLLQEICEMRQQVSANVKPTPKGYFDLKHSHGGLLDIEFLVQYFTLHFAAKYPQIVQQTNNLGLLKQLAKYKCIPIETANLLSETYFFYQSLMHQVSLQNNTLILPIENIQNKHQAVISIVENYCDQYKKPK
jgi:glutamate-ammonia-ligase adenylyltransferase